jgi:Predicted nucleotide-binding protein containing TIR-like domain
MTFSNQLKSFSKAVDIVTIDIKDNILGIIKEKLRTTLGIEFVVLHVETTVDNHLGLNTTDWCIGGGKMGVISIKKSEDTCTRQVALSFDINKPLWIVGSKREDLNNCDHFLDLWSGTDHKLIPSYFKSADSISKTSIIIPLTRISEDTPYAVINFESVKYLECSEKLRNEIKSIAESISRLYQRNQSHLHQVSDTREEIQELGKVSVYDLSKKTSLFFAFSGQADENIINSIQEIFNQAKYTHLDLKRWDRDLSSGIIHKKILEDIRDCQFAICYLSEPDSNDRYKDNANVLIEVGMFWYKFEDFSNVIIVREKNSSRIPFDIAANRIFTVPRETGANTFRDIKFKEEFTKRLDKMISND